MINLTLEIYNKIKLLPKPILELKKTKNMILEKNVKEDQKNLNSISYSKCKNRNLKKKGKKTNS